MRIEVLRKPQPSLNGDTMIFRLSKKLKTVATDTLPLDENPYADWSAHVFTVGLLLVVGTLGCGDKPQSVADVDSAEIEKLGGRVGYDDESPERPIVHVDLHQTDVTDAHLVHLERLTSLQSLYLLDTQITDAGLEHLKGLTRLENLLLGYTDAGLEQQITDYGLVTNAGLEHLKGLTSLQHLGLSGTQITDAGLEHLNGL